MINLVLKRSRLSLRLTNLNRTSLLALRTIPLMIPTQWTYQHTRFSSRVILSTRSSHTITHSVYNRRVPSIHHFFHKVTAQRHHNVLLSWFSPWQYLVVVVPSRGKLNRETALDSWHERRFWIKCLPMSLFRIRFDLSFVSEKKYLGYVAIENSAAFSNIWPILPPKIQDFSERFLRSALKIFSRHNPY